MNHANVYYLMIGAPSDIGNEIEIIKQRIAEWNDNHSIRHKIVIQPLHWCSNTFAASGESPQAIINEQMLDQSDAMIAIFGSRLGSPTSRYESGTVEEIYSHINSNKNVLIFFRESVTPSRSEDGLVQLENLFKFRDEIQKSCLTVDYRDESHFSELFSSHLAKMVNRNFISYTEKKTSKNKTVNSMDDDISAAKKNFFAKLVLLGAIHERSQDNWKLLEKYFDLTKREILNTIREFYHEEFFGITLNNGIWTIKDKFRYWNHLAPFFYDDDLDSFQELSIRVLKNDRQNNFSTEVKSGVAEGVTIIANASSLCCNLTRTNAYNAPYLIHRELFASNTLETWVSLNNILPILSKIAPSLFLSDLSTLLSYIETKPLEIRAPGFYSSLLESLEVLAWHPDYFSQSCELIAKLPLYLEEDAYRKSYESLVEILLPWKTHTLATQAQKKGLIKIIGKVNRKVQRSVLINLLPGKTTFWIQRERPEWLFNNELADEETEFFVDGNMILFYANSLIDDFSDHFEDCYRLAEELKHIPADILPKFCEKLKKNALNSFTQKECMSLVDLIENELLRHRKFPTADWAFNDEEMQLLEELCRDIRPRDLFLQFSQTLMTHGWQYHSRDNDIVECDTKANEEKQHAIRKLISHYGKTRTVELISSLSDAKLATFALADMNDPDLDSIILPDYLGVKEISKNTLAIDYTFLKFHNDGELWFKRIFSKNWTDQQKGQFFTALPFNEHTWQLVEENLGSNDGEYWMYVWPYRKWMTNFNDHPVRKFLQYSKHKEALECLFRMQEVCVRNSVTVNFELVIELLLEIREYSGGLDYYCIETLMKWVQDNWGGSGERIIELEFKFVDSLSYSQHFIPMNIYRKLANDAEYFHEMLSLAYKGEIVDATSSSDRKILASKAHNLLYKWNIVPGVRSADSFDSNHFESWIDTVKQLSEASGHIKIARSTIGTLLIHAPADSDLWVHKTIANELDKEENLRMREAYYCAVYNSRGVHFVDPTGSQEKALAKQYNDRATQLDEHGYSRFATTLRAIADTYNREALQR